MKTPEETKKALALCVNANSYNYPCDECPYEKEEDGCKSMMKDALAYLQQLEQIALHWQSSMDQVQKALQGYGFGSLEELFQAYNQAKRERDQKGYEDGREAGHEWISVEDRLPEEPVVVLVALHGTAVCVAWYRNEQFETGSGMHFSVGYGVTHWMPIPELPKEV